MYGALRFEHADPGAGLRKQTWGWRNGRLWIGCHACGVPRELQPSIGAITSHGVLETVVACDRAGCGVEVRTQLQGWTDLDADLWRQLVTGKGDGDV